MILSVYSLTHTHQLVGRHPLGDVAPLRSAIRWQCREDHGREKRVQQVRK